MKATYEPTDEECEWKADEEQELTVSIQVEVPPEPRGDDALCQYSIFLF